MESQPTDEQGHSYEDRWLTIHDLMEMTGWRSRQTIKRRIQDGVLPEPFYPVQGGAGRWWESEILAAMRELDDREEAGHAAAQQG